MADNLTPEQRRRAMSRIRSRDTKPELRLRQALWSRGIRGYRLHRRDLPGRPDIVWGRRSLAVFVDGAFWHGHPSAFRPGKSGAYWDAKIQRNMDRDRRADDQLVELGFSVLRFWDFEVRRGLELCLVQIEQALGSDVDPAARIRPA